MGNGRGFAGDFDEDEVVNKVLDFVVVYTKQLINLAMYLNTNTTHRSSP